MAMAKESNKVPARTSAPTLKSTPRAQGTSSKPSIHRGAQSVRASFGRAKVS